MNINEFVNKIKIFEEIKEHLIETESAVEEYVLELNKYSDNFINLFLFDAMIMESIASSQLENNLYSPSVINLCERNLCRYNKLNQELICSLNRCILYDMNYPKEIIPGEYRKTIAWVGKKDGKSGIENARYIAPTPELIEQYMNQFLDYYNDDSFDNNAILKSAIIHILFVKIHPFSDGNGREARILHHHKLTELINKKYGTNFLWPIINLSKNLDLTRGNYYENENNIEFNLESDNVVSWNKWFNYVLNMIDENLFFYRNMLREYSQRLNVSDELSKSSQIK